MKRIGRIWNDVLTEENGVRAVIEGTQDKRHKVRQLLYDDEYVAQHRELWHVIDPEKAKAYIRPIIEELRSGSWKHGTPKVKERFCRNRTAGGGKWRTLYVPKLKDHIVAHMIMQKAMPAFTRGMHPNCCGSVPDRGIKHIVTNVENWFKNDKQCRYFVKLDIRKFFDNIDRDILVQKLQGKIKDKFVLEALTGIIDSAPVACPIGYYTSPWFANLYLEDLDHYIDELHKERRGKRIKYVRHYLRYMDDMLLMGTCRKDLEKAVSLIKQYLSDLKLEIKDSWEIKKIGKHDETWKLKEGTYWCDIGGYKFCKDATILRGNIYLSAKRLAKKMNRQGYYTDHQCQSINARIGWSRHADSYNFIENEIKPYVDLKITRRIISDVEKKRKQ